MTSRDRLWTPTARGPLRIRRRPRMAEGYPAKEVRAFDLAGYLGRRFEDLAGEHIDELKKVARRRLRRRLCPMRR